MRIPQKGWTHSSLLKPQATVLTKSDVADCIWVTRAEVEYAALQQFSVCFPHGFACIFLWRLVCGVLAVTLLSQ